MKSRGNRLWRWLFLGVVGWLCLWPGAAARADIAPPQNPPGSNPQPGGSTRVQMVAERVVLDVPMNPEGSPGYAQVQATFWMRNQGTKTETLAVRFPVMFSDGRGGYGEVRDFRVQVEGQEVPTHTIYQPEYFYGDAKVRWREFTVTFPVGKEVTIEVFYTLDGTPMYDYPYVTYGYVLETGAGWWGPIEKADIILRLPYPASPDNVLVETDSGWNTPVAPVFEGREVRWHLENLEPAREHNMEITIILPSAWYRVLRAEEEVQAHPDDGEAWGRLGRFLKEALRGKYGLRMDPSAQRLFQRAQEAYERAVTLLPDDALWHVGYGELLWLHYWWAYDVTYPPEAGVSPEVWDGLMRAVREFHRAYQLAPDDPTVQEVIQRSIYGGAPPFIVSLGNGDYDFPILTATPPPGTLLPTMTPTAQERPQNTATPSPTDSPTPSATPQPTATVTIPAPTPSSTLPSSTPTASPRWTEGWAKGLVGLMLIGTLALVALAALGAVWWWRRQP